MCGIFGFVSGKNVDAGAMLFEGLRKLEYRGYDSCGIGVLDGAKIEVRKDAGKVEEVGNRLSFSSVKGSVGISQTRWATHGGVTQQNAHPHVGCNGGIAIVHNGIIENFQELRLQLQERGHGFSSQTDSEVVAHLFEENLKSSDDDVGAFRKSVVQLRGSYAVLAISSSHPGKVFAAKNESPLVLGAADGTAFFGSDMAPLYEYTQDAVFFEDGEMAVATPQGFQFSEIGTGKLLQKKPVRIELPATSAGKEGHDYYMLKEIMEQPAVLRNALRQDKKLLDDFAGAVKSARGVMLIASGTSLHAAMCAQYLFDKECNLHVNVINASEFGYLEHSLHESSLVIAISQSGETADLIAALKAVKGKGARIFSLVNVVGSTVARMSDNVIYLNAGPEIAVASTKAFTAQLAVFYALAAGLSGNESLRNELAGLPGKMQACIDENDGKARQLAHQLKSNDVYFIGRGINYPVALEGALKLKEISYLHAEGMPAGELKHGTLALISSGVPVIALNPVDETHSACLSNAIETRARGGFVIGVSDSENEAYDFHFKIPTMHELLYPFVSILPLQLLAYHSAVGKGLDPDRPRNLAKSVTVR